MDGNYARVNADYLKPAWPISLTDNQSYFISPFPTIINQYTIVPDEYDYSPNKHRHISQI